MVARKSIWSQLGFAHRRRVWRRLQPQPKCAFGSSQAHSLITETAVGRSFCLVRPAWASTWRWKSSRELVTVSEANRRASDREAGVKEAGTRRSAGRSLAQMCKPLGTYLSGWKAYFRLTEAPGAVAAIDGCVRHRLRAAPLTPWQ